MNEFWLGFFALPLVLLALAGIAGGIAVGLAAWFERGSRMVKRPQTVREQIERARHATVLFTALRVVRVAWIAGIGVYVVRQDNTERFGGETRAGNVQHAIISADQEWRDAHPTAGGDR